MPRADHRSAPRQTLVRPEERGSRLPHIRAARPRGRAAELLRLLKLGYLWRRKKVAVTAVDPITVTVHEPVPLHPLTLQPVKIDPFAGVAVRVTAVPLE